MKKIAEKWLPYAKADMEAAAAMLEQKRKTRWANLIILWHCQQAIEKLLKAVIVENTGEVKMIHDLRKLRKLAGIDFSKKQMDLISSLNKYYLRSRYPNMINAPLPDPDSTTAKRLFDQTDKLHQWLIDYLEKM